jgi:signal peptidase I
MDRKEGNSIEEQRKGNILAEEKPKKYRSEESNTNDLHRSKSIEHYSHIEKDMLKKCRRIYDLANGVQKDVEKLEKVAQQDRKIVKKENIKRNTAYELMEDIKETLTKQRLVTKRGLLERRGKKDSFFSRTIVKAFWIYVYIMLFMLVIGAILFGGEMGMNPPRNIFGHSALIVLSTSMEREYPLNTLIITRQVNPETLEVGDDITYITVGNRVITHRIIEIYENIEINRRGFRTQGLENARPDADIVYAPNVIGKVVFSSTPIGQIIMLVRNNIVPVIGIIVMLGLIKFVIRRFILTN